MTPTPTITTSKINASEDAHVNKSAPDSNYGNATQLEVSASSKIPTYISYMKVSTTSFKGKILKSAKLKFRVTNATAKEHSVYYGFNTSWAESSITYNNSRVFSMTKVATINSATSGSTNSVDVKNAFPSAVTADTVTFMIDTTLADNLKMYSSEGNVIPFLEVTY